MNTVFLMVEYLYSGSHAARTRRERLRCTSACAARSSGFTPVPRFIGGRAGVNSEPVNAYEYVSWYYFSIFN